MLTLLSRGRLPLNTTIRTLWPRQYFTSEWRQVISGDFVLQDSYNVGDRAENPPRRAVCGFAANHMEHSGHHAGCWWTAARGNSYVALYCTVQTSDDYGERRDNRCQVSVSALIVFV